MSRTASSYEPSSESFSALIERLARRVSEDDSFDSKPDTGAKKPGGKRPLLQTSSPAAKSKSALDALPLSYERALQLHGRRRAADGDLKMPAVDPVPAATHMNTHVAPAASNMERVASPKESLKPRRPKPLSHRKKLSQASSQLDPSAAQFRRASARNPEAKSSAEVMIDSRSGRRRSSVGRSSIARASGDKGELQHVRKSQPLERLQHGLGAERRRMTVSVRLSEQESTQLRQRAAESGISVSAYMRSCVLEADHLRAQVKQALAEMRLVAQSQRPVPLPALRDGGSGWSRFLSRSATFLFGPWFPMRRRA